MPRLFVLREAVLDECRPVLQAVSSMACTSLIRLGAVLPLSDPFVLFRLTRHSLRWQRPKRRIRMQHIFQDYFHPRVCAMRVARALKPMERIAKGTIEA